MRKTLEKIPFFGVFTSVLATNTFRQSSVTFIGTVITGALGAIFYIIAARFLGPADFGLLNVSIVTMTLVADIGDLGTDTGLVNFVARYIKKEEEKAHKFIKLSLEVKIIVSSIVLILGLWTASKLANQVFIKPQLIQPLKIASLGVSSFLLFSFITRILQAYQKFWAWSLIQIGQNLMRLILFYLIFSFGILSIDNTMWVYILTLFLGFILGLYIISPRFLKAKNEWEVSGEFFSYNKWVAAFTLLAAFSSRLDTFISARLLSSVELGIYSAAQQMVKIVPMIVVALGTVIAPKMASMDGVDELIRYMKKTQALVLGLALMGIFSIPAVLWLITPIFGEAYMSAGPYFVILLLGMLVFLISVPIHMSVFYYFSYPKLFFWVSLGHLLIIAIMGWNMVSSFGAMGAAFTVLVGQIFNFVVPAYWVLRKVISSRK